MKKNIRSERGITLTVLVITVVVLSILSFTIIINMKTRTNISKLSLSFQKAQVKLKIILL